MNQISCSVFFLRWEYIYNLDNDCYTFILNCLPLVSINQKSNSQSPKALKSCLCALLVHHLCIFISFHHIWLDRHSSALNKCAVFISFGNQKSLTDKLQLEDSLTEIYHCCSTMLSEIEDLSDNFSMCFCFKPFSALVRPSWDVILLLLNPLAVLHRCDVMQHM